MLTYSRYDIVFQEIPNEVSLAFTIEGCPNNCDGCHSPHLREQNGSELTEELLLSILDKHENMITCVLFLGGDRFHNEIYNLSNVIHSRGIKTAFYSGDDVINGDLVEVLDYYKVGSYNKTLGGLKSKMTNQKLYKIQNVTEEFWDE